jgi:hypothetical protein
MGVGRNPSDLCRSPRVRLENRSQIVQTDAVQLCDSIPSVHRKCDTGDVATRVAAQVDHRLRDILGFDYRYRKEIFHGCHERWMILDY